MSRTAISCLLLVISVCLYIISFRNPSRITTLFSESSYYLMGLVWGAWIISLVGFCLKKKYSIPSLIRRHRSGLFLTFLLTSIVFTSVPTSLRVLSDEANILSVSKSMIFEKRVDYSPQGFWQYGNFWPVGQREIEKRPLLFPFLTHLIHVGTGYRAANVFATNFFVLWALFFIIYILLRKVVSPLWASSSLVLIASQPALSIAANSGGVDTLNVMLIFLSFACLHRFLSDRTETSFNLLWFTCILLAHTRAESIIFFMITIFLLFIFRTIKIDFFKSSVLYALTPLLLLPIFWLRVLKTNDPEIAHSTQLFAFNFRSFMENNSVFFKNLFSFDFSLPYNNIINLVGLVGLVYLLVAFLRNSRSVVIQKGYPLAVISVVNITALWIIITAYFYGKMDHPVSSRFFLTFIVIGSILASLFIHKITKKRNFRPVYFLIFSFSLFMLYHPTAVEDRFTNSLYLTKEYRYVNDFFKQQAQTDKNFLVITYFPNHLTIHNYGAVHFGYANKNKSSILLRYARHMVSNIFVVQHIDQKTALPMNRTALDPAFKLRTKAELKNSTEMFTRISQVVNKR